MKKIGIIDEANPGGKKDNLGIELHTNSLIKFINETSTPITVGIQGEWGSGKTSLINSIHHSFESQEKVKQIWINAWEYSLLSSPEEALLKIVTRMIDELVEADPNKERVEKIKKGAQVILKGALRIGASATLGLEAGKVAEELTSSSGVSISALRKQLTSVVEEMAKRDTNPYEKVIIYVDDLDRIEPKNAVAILELLKNIFSVPKCVFILAIDYQVVVKGLEDKFGKQTAENEWEFRAFFDKIIQLPFMMPMGQYNIGQYVNSLLVEIGFVEGDGLDDLAVREIIMRTIGGNPRSIKRLVNSVSLIQIFSEEKQIAQEKNKKEGITSDPNDDAKSINQEDEKFILFALLCLQIAFPPVYSLLSREPNFILWNDELAFKETNRSEERAGAHAHKTSEETKKIFDTEFETAKKTDDFNEEWEQALFRICYGRPRLKPRAADISKFFSYIKDDLLADKQEDLGSIIAEILNETSVTSVTSTDQGQIVLPEREGAYKRRYLDGLDAWLLDKTGEPTDDGWASSQQLDEEAAKFIRVLHDDIKENFPEAEIMYAGEITCYIEKHKLLGFGGCKEKGKIYCDILRHYDNDYKMPMVGNNKPYVIKKFVETKHYSTRGSERCGFVIPSLKFYEENKEKYLKVLKSSADMALTENWKKRLNISYAKGTISSVTVNLNYKNPENPKIVEACKKYLDPDYTYEVS